MMNNGAPERPILAFTSEHFMQGIAPGALFQNQGLFFVADGVTPLIEPGTAESKYNGMLMANAKGTTIGGTLTGNIIGATKDFASTSTAYFATDDGNLWSLLLDPTFGSALGNIHTISGQASGLEVFGSYLYYGQTSQIGRYDYSTFTDAWKTTSDGVQTDYVRATHVYFDQLLIGNGFGQLSMVDSSGNYTADALDFYNRHIVTDISDDGTYAAIAITDNQFCDPNAMADTRVLFWDGYSPSWLRDYPIPDPYIFSLQKTSFGLYAFGMTGVWKIKFSNSPDFGISGGVEKIYGRSTGIYSVNKANALLYGRVTSSFYNQALLWGGASGANYSVKSFGKLDTNAPNALIHPFRTPNGHNLTYIDGQMLKGYVFVGTDTPSLIAYPLSNAGADTSLAPHAQTIFLPLPYKMEISHVFLIFGEPLASGDQMDVTVYGYPGDTGKSYGSASYATSGATQIVKLYPTAGKIVSGQVSVDVSFAGGNPKLLELQVYGKPMNV